VLPNHLCRKVPPERQKKIGATLEEKISTLIHICCMQGSVAEPEPEPVEKNKLILSNF
jgi:hypothetical protein